MKGGSALVGLAVTGLVLLAACDGDSRASSPATTGPVVTTTVAPTSNAPPSTPAPGDGTTVAPPALDEVGVALTQIAELDEPIALAIRPGHEDRLFVAQRGGQVVSLAKDGSDPQPVIDVSDEIIAGGERGLLGLTFDPEGAHLYLSFTADDGANTLVEYALGAEREHPRPGVEAGRAAGRPPSRQPQRRQRDLRSRRPPLHRSRRRWRRRGPGRERPGPRRPARQDPAHRPHAPGRPALRRSRRTTPSPAGAGGARCTSTGCATRGGSPSTGRRATSGSATSARARSRRSTSCRPARPPAPTSAGTASKARGRSRVTPRPTPWPPCSSTDETGAVSVVGGFVYRGARIPGLQGAYLFTDAYRSTIRALAMEDGQVTDDRDLAEVASGQGVSFGRGRRRRALRPVAGGPGAAPRPRPRRAPPGAAPACQAERRAIRDLRRRSGGRRHRGPALRTRARRRAGGAGRPPRCRGGPRARARVARRCRHPARPGDPVAGRGRGSGATTW